ncbi:PrsW family intramembrane metalloprotease [Verminephrobacter eiseniae]|uniref:PrsW family intramembrane metalloprotease n=1 Tax=Verminephrobacter eiseniae TaxID=364317 RepID=UPI0022387354|nr:PrsW family intramembrane metalloprotease [Verminephrobacter eiseniae]
MSTTTEAIATQEYADWPIGTDSFFQPQRAAFWQLAALIVNGLFYTAAFVLFFRTLDLLEQHPPEACVLAFAWGGLGAMYFAAPANIAIQSLCAKLVSPEFVAGWGPAIAGPITEDFLKLADVILLLIARNHFETYLSVLIVGAMAGLGFQVIEDLSYTVNSAVNFPLENQVHPVLYHLLMRGLLSGLWSHAAYTTIVSFGVAWFLLNPQRSMAVRIGCALFYFALAWAMHFIWNSPLLRYRVRRDGQGVRQARPPPEGAAAARAVAAHPEGRHARVRAADAAP